MGGRVSKFSGNTLVVNDGVEAFDIISIYLPCRPFSDNLKNVERLRTNQQQVLVSLVCTSFIIVSAARVTGKLAMLP
jgi:hypothetical protein